MPVEARESPDLCFITFHWSNGAYISGVCRDFHKDLDGLIKQFGLPNRVKPTRSNGMGCAPSDAA